MKDELYHICYRNLGKIVIVKRKSKHGIVEERGKMLLPYYDFVEIRQYQYSGPSYILQIPESDVISIIKA